MNEEAHDLEDDDADPDGERHRQAGSGYCSAE
jgi:hypothetical protein